VIEGFTGFETRSRKSLEIGSGLSHVGRDGYNGPLRGLCIFRSVLYKTLRPFAEHPWHTLRNVIAN
jgi:hypothetical protein